jgi:alpha-tubulin suppressor-like RCC1 family protein
MIPATVTIPSGQSSATFDVTVIDDADLDGTQNVTITAAASGWTSDTAGIDIEDNDTPDYFTQEFYSVPDISNQTLTFTPDGSGNFYSVCRSPAANFPIDPAAGATLSLDDDDYLGVTLAGGAQVSFFGVSYSSFYVGSNGYLTFVIGDDTYYDDSLYDHFNLPRVSGFFSDLNPSAGGTISWQQMTDRIVVTFEDVPEYGSSNSNNFQVEIFFDGVIRLTYLGLDASTGVAGLSAGAGEPEDFIASDLSAYGGCISLSLPSGAVENDGVLAGQGAVNIPYPLTTDLEISLVSDDTSEITLPAGVTIFAGQTSASFDVTVVDDNLLDGTQIVSITVLPPGQAPQAGSIQVHDDETALLTVAVPDNAMEGDGLLTGQGTVSVNTAVDSDVTVWLDSDDPGEVMVPQTVTIFTGLTSADFDLTIVDDAEVDGEQTATITAAVTGWSSGSGTINVQDNENITLTVVVPPAAAEGDGVLASAGNVTIPGALGTDLVVDLASDDVSEATVPATVTIPAGQISAAFDLTVLDDAEVDGTQTVTVTAAATGWTSGTAAIDIEDNEIRDYFTQEFDDVPDISNQTLTFAPDGSVNFYKVCRSPAANFPIDPAGGTTLALGDDDYLEVPLPGGAQVALFGVRYSSFYVGSNGYITFITGDDDYDESLFHHFNQPRIAGLLSDLNPSNYGTISWQQMADRIVVSFQDVPEYGTSNSNNFQIEMFFDGVIRLTHLRLDIEYGVSGLSAGSGLPADFQASDLSAYGDCFSLSIPSGAVETEGVLAGQGLVQIATPLTTDLAVSLASDDTSEITVPAGVTIFAAQTSASFDVTVVDDNLLDGTQTVSITASAPGQGLQGRTIQVHDSETAVLTVNVPDNAVETDGTLSGQGTVSVDTAVDSDVTVRLNSDDPGEVMVPQTVTILTGETSATFDLMVFDDGEIDGGQTVTVSAAVVGWTLGSDTMDVIDNESMDLIVALPENAGERSGVLANGGTVSISGFYASDLIIDLLSDDTTTVTVPATLTIPTGQTTASFDLTIIDDAAVDGTQTVTITAAAAGWTSGSGTIYISDNDGIDFYPSIAAGRYHNLALKDDGTVWAWGYNNYGQLGDGSTAQRNSPVGVLNLSNIVGIAAGIYHSIALAADGSVWTWGGNNYGQLGDGSYVQKTSPEKVSNLTNIVEIAAGLYHSVALGADGSVWAWGHNGNGELGDGTTTHRTSPVQVSNLTNIAGIAAGNYHSLAVRADGSVWTWGYNYNGQLGIGSTVTRTSPVQVPNLTQIAGVAAGSFHSLALTTDGTLWAWGRNNYGQLGDGTTTQRYSPVEVSNLTNIIEMAPSLYHSLALKADGTVWAWGYNNYGQLGDGTTTQRTSPVEVSNLSNVIGISAGDYHSLALKADGTIWAWGRNNYGQLGDGTIAQKNTPVAVHGSGGEGFLDLRSLAIVIPTSATEGDGLLSGQGTVIVDNPVTSDLVVILVSGNTAEVTLPTSVTIAAGQASVTFDLTIVDDVLLDGTQTTSITATASGYYEVETTIWVHDNDTAVLTVSLPDSAAEGDGLLSGVGTVTADTPVDADILVFLTSDDPAEVSVPDAVTISAGLTSAAFDLTIVDDTEIDGQQPVTITAAVTNWTSASGAIEVADNETRELAVNLLAAAIEGDGTLAAAGNVALTGTYAEDLVVDLTSDDISEVTLPATLTIAAGQTLAFFDLTIVDDGDIDGLQTVTVSASAAGWSHGNATIVVADNDPGELQFAADTFTVDEGDGSAVITVVRTTSSSGSIAVDMPPATAALRPAVTTRPSAAPWSLMTDRLRPPLRFQFWTIPKSSPTNPCS